MYIYFVSFYIIYLLKIKKNYHTNHKYYKIIITANHIAFSIL